MKINSISPFSFTHRLKEHKSWGANYDEDKKDVSFKIFTFPDVKNAFVTVEKKDKTIQIPLKNKGEGVFEAKKDGINPDDKYYYTLIYKNGEQSGPLKDPYSFKQDDFMGKSVIYNQNAYNWKDKDWFSSKNTSRISRIANQKNSYKPVSSLRIYEVNIATLTKNGDFKTAKEAVKRIKDLGFNAVEIMPVEGTFSYNWGYDGVDKFAPSKYLGGPDGLKEFIDCLHNEGLNVIMDMVPNHLGPDGLELHRFGPYIGGPNGFGSSFNFEGENSKYVRDFVVNACLNWISNYHCDGLRLDATKYMNSDFTMKQIAQEVNYHYPNTFLIAEDGRYGLSTDGNNIFSSHNCHDERIIHPLKDFEINFKTEKDHAKAIETMDIENTNCARLGYDSEWDFNYYYTLFHLRDFDFDNPNNEADKYNMIEDYICAVIESQKRVKYVMSHDEIGNYSGTRLISKLLMNRLNLKSYVEFDNADKMRIEKLKEKGKSENEAIDCVRDQKANLIAQKLAEGIQKGKFDYYKDSTFKTKISELGLRLDYSLNRDNIKQAFVDSFNKTKVLQASTFAIPGAKMVFQGDESASLTPFRFFREFSDSKKDNYNLYISKGYKGGLSALNVSKLNNKKPKNKYGVAFQKLTEDLNRLNEEFNALQEGYIEHNSIVKHPSSGVVAYKIKDDKTKKELYVISNYSNKSYSDNQHNSYKISFPKGTWKEVLNTDDSIYLGEDNKNTEPIASKDDIAEINLGKNSCIIFERIDK